MPQLRLRGVRVSGLGCIGVMMMMTTNMMIIDHDDDDDDVDDAEADENEGDEETIKQPETSMQLATPLNCWLACRIS